MQLQRRTAAFAIGLMIAGLGWPRATNAQTASHPSQTGGKARVPSPDAAAPALMLAQEGLGTDNPQDFLVSEKLDGVRALWDGRQLRFRSGRVIAAPAWFTAGFPAQPLDGELWMGRRRFDVLSGTVRKAEPVDAQWREVRYMVFDMPGAEGSFAQRVPRIVHTVAEAKVDWLQAVAQSRGVDAKALKKRLATVLAQGGEGLMLHRADALWQPGRSDALRKLKPAPDAEARVVGTTLGKGRHAGRMGALLLEMPDGTRFYLGTGFSDAMRANPPAVGSTVTYRYRERTPNGVPRFASFLRVREEE